MSDLSNTNSCKKLTDKNKERSPDLSSNWKRKRFSHSNNSDKRKRKQKITSKDLPQSFAGGGAASIASASERGISGNISDVKASENVNAVEETRVVRRKLFLMEGVKNLRKFAGEEINQDSPVCLFNKETSSLDIGSPSTEIVRINKDEDVKDEEQDGSVVKDSVGKYSRSFSLSLSQELRFPNFTNVKSDHNFKRCNSFFDRNITPLSSVRNLETKKCKNNNLYSKLDVTKSKEKVPLLDKRTIGKTGNEEVARITNERERRNPFKVSILMDFDRMKKSFESHLESEKKRVQHNVLESISSDEEDNNNGIKWIAPEKVRLNQKHSCNKKVKSWKKTKHLRGRNALFSTLSVTKSLDFDSNNPELIKNDATPSLCDRSTLTSHQCSGTDSNFSNKIAFTQVTQEMKKTDDYPMKPLSPILCSKGNKSEEPKVESSSKLPIEQFKTPVKGVPRKVIENEIELLDSGSKRKKKYPEDSLVTKFRTVMNRFESNVRFWHYETENNMVPDKTDLMTYKVDHIWEEYSNTILKCSTDVKVAETIIIDNGWRVRRLPNYFLLLTEWGVLNNLKISTGCKFKVYKPWKVLLHPKKHITWLLGSPYIKVVERPLRETPLSAMFSKILKSKVDSNEKVCNEVEEKTEEEFSCACYKDMNVNPDCSLVLPNNFISRILIPDQDIVQPCRRVPILYTDLTKHEGTFSNGRAYWLLRHPLSTIFIVTIQCEPMECTIHSAGDDLSLCKKVLVKDNLGEFSFLVLRTPIEHMRWLHSLKGGNPIGQTFKLTGFDFWYYMPIERCDLSNFDELRHLSGQTEIHHLKPGTVDWKVERI